MKQRLGLAAALLQPRDLLILDEPTNGLDPQGTREVRHLVRDLASDGTTVLVSSHLLSEIEQVATHVGIMSAGTLLRQGTLSDVLSDGSTVVRADTPDLEPARLVLENLGLLDIASDHRASLVTARLRPYELTARLGGGCWPGPRPRKVAGYRAWFRAWPFHMCEEAPVFTERTSVGLDVHARSVAAAAIDGQTGQVFKAQ